HNAAFQALGRDAVYMAFDVAPERLMQVLPSMAAMGFGGINLTVPLKEVAFRGLDDLDPLARRLGAVNTVEILPTGLKGHNTDGRGFLRAIAEAFDFNVAGRSIFILGCGGAGRALALTAAAEGAARLVLADLDPARPARVCEEIRDLAPKTIVEISDSDPTAWPRASRKVELVVQATPVGMHDHDPSPLPAGAFRSGQYAMDLVYMRPETAFMRAATEAGARAINGLGMLLHQGAESFRIWTGAMPPLVPMRKALEQAVYGHLDRR
ncbi:MAG: shikimate dehydrogenase, partial [bacterium]